jgi:uncharacterized protein (DUF1778 family)
MAKSANLLIRLEPEEKQAFHQAAEIAGIPLSSWMRERLRRAAIRELESAGKPIAFIPPVPLGGPNE